MPCRSPIERARRSTRVNQQHVALANEVETVHNSARRCVLVPLCFSARITSQPAARNADYWIARS